jgi:hypothetical protein
MDASCIARKRRSRSHMPSATSTSNNVYCRGFEGAQWEKISTRGKTWTGLYTYMHRPDGSAVLHCAAKLCRRLCRCVAAAGGRLPRSRDRYGAIRCALANRQLRHALGQAHRQSRSWVASRMAVPPVPGTVSCSCPFGNTYTAQGMGGAMGVNPGYTSVWTREAA